MTIAELKKLLDRYPDDTEVRISSGTKPGFLNAPESDDLRSVEYEERLPDEDGTSGSAGAKRERVAVLCAITRQV